MDTAPMYTFDTFSPDADHTSDRWSTTARGWLHIDGECRGFYLDYRSFRHIGYVVACAYERVKDPVTGYDRGTCHNRSAHFQTLEDAQQWLLAETIGQLAFL